ncbi:MAG TPA: hypothetical protein VIF62_26465 [Labilithrix sp.]
MVGLRRSLLVVASALVLACGGGGSASSDEAPSAAADAQNQAWQDVLPDADCAAGTRPAVGSKDCVPVGTAGCAAGFSPDPSGWGCRDIQPASACTGATREALGSTSCVPIGDCDAAFPPSNATVFVDASFTDTQLDSAHFRTIASATDAAPAGSVIAVAPGTYTESVSVRTSGLTIAGKCARDVIVVSPDGQKAGIEAGGMGTAVRGMTLRGHRGGVVSVLHASADVSDCLVENSKLAGLVVSTGSMTVERTRVVDTTDLGGNGGEGLLVQHGTLTVKDSAVVRSMESGAAAVFGDAKIHVEHSIIRDTAVASDGASGGAGISTLSGATVEVVESAIVSSHQSGVEIVDSGHGTVTGSVVRDVQPNGRGDHGDALAVGESGTLTVDGTTAIGGIQLGVMAVGPATLKITSSVVIGEYNGFRSGGFTVSSGAKATVDGLAIVKSREIGIVVQDPDSVVTAEHVLVRDVLTASDDDDYGQGIAATYGAELDVTDSAVVQAANAAFVVGGSSTGGAKPSHAKLDKIVALDPRQNPSMHYGRGVEVTSGAQVEITSSIVSGAPEIGILSGQNDSHVSVTGTVVARTGAPNNAFQHGVCALGGSMLDVSSSLIRDSGGAALAYAEVAGGRIDGVLVQHNTIGLAVKDGALREVDTTPDTSTPGEVDVSATQFIDNTNRVSSDDVPMPNIRSKL